MKLMLTPAAVWRALLAFMASVAVAHVFSSVCQSVLVMAALQEVGAEFSFATRLRVIGHDLVGLLFSSDVPFGFCLLLGFAIALPLAAALVRLLRLPPAVLYPLAGAACVATILHLIQANFFYHMTFMEGTRGAFGYALQLVAGALGGAAFRALRSRGARPS